MKKLQLYLHINKKVIINVNFTFFRYNYIRMMLMKLMF